MSKIKYLILFVIMGVFIIYAFYSTEIDVSKNNVNSFISFDENILNLAEIENELAAQKKLHIHTDSSEEQDYTTLFPELYTVYNVPSNMENDKKIAYISFDDGPSANTFEILDILEDMNVNATFFIVGSAITKEGEEALRRMTNEGHTIGIHTYSHLCDKMYCSLERFLDEYNMVYEQIYDITGKRASIYRMPWGSNNGYSRGIKDTLLDEMERRGFACYDWNVDSNDSVGRPTAYSIRRNVEKDLEAHNFPIVLMHDSGINKLTVQILPEIIKMIKDKGYEFDTLDNREPYQFDW